MTVAEQVEYESSVRRRYATVTFVAAVLIIVSQLFSLTGGRPSVNELTTTMIVDNQHAATDIVAAVLQGLGYVALGIGLSWLYQVARARNPEMKGFLRYLVIVGIALSAALGITYAILVAIKAHQFVTTGDQGYPEAYALVNETAILIMPLFIDLGSLMLAVGVIWTSLSAMRVGLIPKAIGYTGVIAGALILFPIPLIVPVIQGFWLAAVAVIMWGRWPNGDPPAWAAGVAVPWQPMQAQTGASNRPVREPRPRQRRRMNELPTIVEADEQPQTPAPSPAPSAQKRKRKRK